MFEFIISTFFRAISFALFLSIILSLIFIAIEYISSNLISFILYQIGILKKWCYIKIRFNTIQVSIEIVNLSLGEKALKVLQWPWQRWVPLEAIECTIGRARVTYSFWTLDIKAQASDFVLNSLVTHPIDWNADINLIYRVSIMIKHRYLNFLTSILTRKRGFTPKYPHYLAFLIDFFVTKLSLDVAGVRISTVDPHTDYEWGIKMDNFSLTPGTATEETMNAVPRELVCIKYKMFVNSPDNSRAQEILNSFPSRTELDDFIIAIDKLILKVDFPHLFGCIWQPGELPFERAKRIRVGVQAKHVHYVIQEDQYHMYQFWCLKGAGNYEWRPWKQKMVRKMNEFVHTPSLNEATLYISLYKALCATKTGSQGLTFDWSPTLEQLLKLEWKLSFQSIMTLRRRALNLIFSPNDVRLVSRTQDSLMNFDHHDEGDLQDILMSRIIASERPYYEEQWCMVREVFIDPVVLDSIKVSLIKSDSAGGSPCGISLHGGELCSTIYIKSLLLSHRWNRCTSACGVRMGALATICEPNYPWVNLTVEARGLNWVDESRGTGRVFRSMVYSDHRIEPTNGRNIYIDYRHSWNNFVEIAVELNSVIIAASLIHPLKMNIDLLMRTFSRTADNPLIESPVPEYLFQRTTDREVDDSNVALFGFVAGRNSNDNDIIESAMDKLISQHFVLSNTKCKYTLAINIHKTDLIYIASVTKPNSNIMFVPLSLKCIVGHDDKKEYIDAIINELRLKVYASVTTFRDIPRNHTDWRRFQRDSSRCTTGIVDIENLRLNYNGELSTDVDDIDMLEMDAVNLMKDCWGRDCNRVTVTINTFERNPFEIQNKEQNDVMFVVKDMHSIGNTVHNSHRSSPGVQSFTPVQYLIPSVSRINDLIVQIQAYEVSNSDNNRKRYIGSGHVRGSIESQWYDCVIMTADNFVVNSISVCFEVGLPIMVCQIYRMVMTVVDVESEISMSKGSVEAMKLSASVPHPCRIEDSKSEDEASRVCQETAALPVTANTMVNETLLFAVNPATCSETNMRVDLLAIGSNEEVLAACADISLHSFNREETMILRDSDGHEVAKIIYMLKWFTNAQEDVDDDAEVITMLTSQTDHSTDMSLETSSIRSERTSNLSATHVDLDNGAFSTCSDGNMLSMQLQSFDQSGSILNSIDSTCFEKDFKIVSSGLFSFRGGLRDINPVLALLSMIMNLWTPENQSNASNSNISNTDTTTAVNEDSQIQMPNTTASLASISNFHPQYLQHHPHHQHCGYLSSECRDWTSYTVISSLIRPHMSILDYIVKTSPRVRTQQIWSVVDAAIAAVEFPDTLTSSSPSESMNPHVLARVLKRLQSELVIHCKNYAFAQDLWGLLLVPVWLDLPRIGNLHCGSKKKYAPMSCPIMSGASLFIDVNVSLVRVEGDTQGICDLKRLSGLRTARSDKGYLGSQFLDFEVSGPCQVFLCWDSRCRVLPRWVKRRNYVLSNIRIRTSASIHLVYTKTVLGASIQSLGGCGCSLARTDNYFVLLGRLDPMTYGSQFQFKSSYSVQSMYAKPLPFLHVDMPPVWMLKPTTTITSNAASSGGSFLQNEEDQLNSPLSHAMSASQNDQDIASNPVRVGLTTHSEGTDRKGSTLGMAGSIGSLNNPNRASPVAALIRCVVKWTFTIDEIFLCLEDHSSSTENHRVEFRIVALSCNNNMVFTSDETCSALTRLAASGGAGFDGKLIKETTSSPLSNWGLTRSNLRSSSSHSEQSVLDYYRLDATLRKLTSCTPLLIEILTLQKLSLVLSATVIYTLIDALNTHASKEPNSISRNAYHNSIEDVIKADGDSSCKQNYIEFFVENKLGQDMFIEFSIPFDIYGSNLFSYEGEDYTLPLTTYLEADNAIYRIPVGMIMAFRISIGPNDFRNPLDATTIRVHMDGWEDVEEISFDHFYDEAAFYSLNTRVGSTHLREGMSYVSLNHTHISGELILEDVEDVEDVEDHEMLPLEMSLNSVVGVDVDINDVTAKAEDEDGDETVIGEVSIIMDNNDNSRNNHIYNNSSNNNYVNNRNQHRAFTDSPYSSNRSSRHPSLSASAPSTPPRSKSRKSKLRLSPFALVVESNNLHGRERKQFELGFRKQSNTVNNVLNDSAIGPISNALSPRRETTIGQSGSQTHTVETPIAAGDICIGASSRDSPMFLGMDESELHDTSNHGETSYLTEAPQLPERTFQRELRVVSFSTNINIVNNSTVPLNIKDVNADTGEVQLESVLLESEGKMPLPLSVLRCGRTVFQRLWGPESLQALAVSCVIQKESFDSDVPFYLRRSIDHENAAISLRTQYADFFDMRYNNVSNKGGTVSETGSVATGGDDRSIKSPTSKKTGIEKKKIRQKLRLWEVTVHPAMSFINAIPCDMELQIVQPPESSPVSPEHNRREDQDGALQLFYLPEEYYTRSSRRRSEDKSTGHTYLTEKGGWLPFIDNNKTKSATSNSQNHRNNHDNDNFFEVLIKAGESFELPSFYSDRSIYFRLRLPGTDVWSKTMCIFTNVLCQRTRFHKHAAELIDWSGTNQFSAAFKTHAPKIFMIRSWKETNRRVEFFSKYWVVNKSGLAMRYLPNPSSKLMDSNANGHYNRNRATNGKINLSHDQNSDLETMYRASTDTCDTMHALVVKSLDIPLMTDCHDRRLSVLPYALMNDTFNDQLYVYDLHRVDKKKERCGIRTIDREEMYPYINSSNIVITEWPQDVYDDTDSSLDEGIGATVTTSGRSGTSTTQQVRGSRSVLIQTTTSDWDHPGSPGRSELITFRPSKDCFVNLCLDSRRSSLPGWALRLGFRLRKGFIRCKKLNTNNSNNSNNHSSDYENNFEENHEITFQIYRRFCRQESTVVLGANLDGLNRDILPDPTSEESMYFAFVSDAHGEKYSCITGLRVLYNTDIFSHLRGRYFYRQLPNFSIGDSLFVDSNIVCTNLPEGLKKTNLLAIQTAQEDLRLQTQILLSFKVEQHSRVLLCIDSSVNELPAWVSKYGFKRTREVLSAGPAVAVSQRFDSKRRGDNLQNDSDSSLANHISKASSPTRLGNGSKNGRDNSGKTRKSSRSPSRRKVKEIDNVTLPHFEFDIYARKFDNADDLMANFRNLQNSGARFNYFILVLPDDEHNQYVYIQNNHLSSHDNNIENTCNRLNFDSKGLLPANTLNEFWDPSVCEKLYYQQPSLEPAGRQWSQPFDVANGNKGELLTKSCALSVTVKKLPGIFNRTNAVVLLPRFIVYNKTSYNLCVLPFAEYDDDIPKTVGVGHFRYDLPQLSQESGVQPLSLPSHGSGVIYSFAHKDKYDTSERKHNPNGGQSGVAPRKIGIASTDTWSGVASSKTHSPSTSTASLLSPYTTTTNNNNTNTNDQALPSVFSMPVSCSDIGDQYVWLPESHRQPLYNSVDSLLDVNNSKSDSTRSVTGGVVGAVAGIIDSSQIDSNNLIREPKYLAVIQASVMLEDTTVIVTLTDASTQPPLRIENRTSVGIRYRYFDGEWCDLTPHSWTKGVFPPNSGEAKRARARCVTVCVAGYEAQAKTYSFDDLRRLSDLVFGNGFNAAVEGGRLSAQTHVDGATRVLTMTEVAPKASRDSQINSSNSSTLDSTPKGNTQTGAIFSSNQAWETRFRRRRGVTGGSSTILPLWSSNSNLLHINCIFPGFAINILSENLAHRKVAHGDSRGVTQVEAAETLSIHIEGIHLLFDGLRSTIDIGVYHIQFDDMRPNPRFPVILAPSDSGHNSHLHRSLDEDTHWLHIHCDWQDTDHTSPMMQLSGLEVILQELQVRLDMELVMDCVGVLGEMVLMRGLPIKRNHHQRSTTSNHLFGPDEVVHDAVMKAVQDILRYDLTTKVISANENFLNNNIFIEVFHHSSVVLHVELYIGHHLLHLDTTSNFERSVATGFAVLGGPVLSFVTGIVGSIAHVSPTLVFNEVVISNYFGSWHKLLKTLIASFRQQALVQTYKIFGSIEVLGDPLSLVDSVGSGVVQFYRRTRAEMIGDSKTRGQGLRDLMRGVVGGAFGSASKITGSLAEMVHGLGALAASDRVLGTSGQGYTYNDYKQSNRFGVDPAQKAIKVLWRGLAAGVTSLIDEPRFGLERAGALGAVGGVLSGVLKLITEPVGGALDAMSISMSGIQTSMKGKPVGRRKAPQQILNTPHGGTAVGIGTVTHEQEALAGSILLSLNSDNEDNDDNDNDEVTTTSYIG